MFTWQKHDLKLNIPFGELTLYSQTGNRGSAFHCSVPSAFFWAGLTRWPITTRTRSSREGSVQESSPGFCKSCSSQCNSPTRGTDVRYCAGEQLSGALTQP